jgi:cysteinyl-tRNA synthetase
MQIHLFNTLTHKEEPITTLEPGHLKMYVCGPTVYDRPHIGNARSAVIYDLLFRFARVVFPKVTYVRNITDVDDKINKAAKEQKISIQELTQTITDFFYADIGALNVLRPTHEPRATENIAEIITMIEKLIANGNAYVNKGHVLFNVSSYADYGKLANRQLDEMIAGSRIEVADYKNDPLDFVLWKPADDEDDISSVFQSPWGDKNNGGRPGWHIECSAMSSKYLGTDFDIHGGGADLQFPHHENEIAQSRCATPGSHYARFWVHNGFLTVNGEKMSKSLKNFITVRDLLDQGVSGITIRYLLLSSHYRKPLDFTQKALDDAKYSLEKFHETIASDFNQSPSNAVPSIVLTHLAEDLNMSKVIAELHQMSKKGEKADLAATLDFLGLYDQNFLSRKVKNFSVDESFINEQIALRLIAKQEKNFAEADRIRKSLLEKGINLEDVSGGKTIWKST